MSSPAAPGATAAATETSGGGTGTGSTTGGTATVEPGASGAMPILGQHPFGPGFFELAKQSRPHYPMEDVTPTRAR